jgi:peptidoglycan hydrolase CwlO-like protein
MNKKLISWLLAIALIVAWGINKHNSDLRNAKIKATIDLKVSEEFKQQAKKDLDKMLSILDDLRKGMESNDSGSSGNNGV